MPPQAQRYPTQALAGIPVLAALLALLPALSAGFVHDDARQILANPLLRDLAHLPELWTTGVWAGAGSGSSWYRPLMMSSFALDHALFGFAPAAMHAVQLGLFAGVVLLGVRLMQVVEGDLVIAVLAGLLFAVHPLGVEPAVWISARCELLAAGGGLAALLLHRRALVSSDTQRARGARAGAAACLALALFGKENAVGFLPALLALDILAHAPFTPRALASRYAGIAVACALYAGLRIGALGSFSGGLAGPLEPGVLLGALGQGALRLVWPVDLTISPPPPGPGHVWLGAALLAGLLGAAAVALKRRSTVLLPLVLGGSQAAIAVVAAARVGELADRYLLVPCLCATWLAARGLLSLPAPLRRLAPAAGLGLAAILATATWSHAHTYASDTLLWNDAWAKNPRSLRAALNLAAVHLDQGDAATAEAWLDRAAALDPDDRQVALNRAVAAQQLGRPAEAERILRALVTRNPHDARAQIALAHLALDRRDWAGAAEGYRAGLAVFEGSAEAWAGLGVASYELGERAAARAALTRALALAPDMQNAAALRRMLRSLGDAPPGAAAP